MDKDGLDGLIALKLVAEKLNFRAAAEDLRVSPSALSKMIRNLEKRLGIALLSRTTRSTSVTEAGEKFLVQAGPALDQILLALKDVSTYAAKPSGLLRLNIPLFSYAECLEPLIASFIGKHPDVSVDVFFEETESDVVSKGFDAGVRDSDILAKDMVALKLMGPIRFVVVGSPKYLNKMGRPKHPKDLLLHNCIRVRADNDWIYDRWEFDHKGKAFEVHVKGSLLLNDTTQALNAACNHLGLMYVTEDFAKQKIASKKLEVVLYPFAPTSEGYFLYFPKRSQVQPKLRAFIEHIKGQAVTK